MKIYKLTGIATDLSRFDEFKRKYLDFYTGKFYEGKGVSICIISIKPLDPSNFDDLLEVEIEEEKVNIDFAVYLDLYNHDGKGIAILYSSVVEAPSFNFNQNQGKFETKFTISEDMSRDDVERTLLEAKAFALNEHLKNVKNLGFDIDDLEIDEDEFYMLDYSDQWKAANLKEAMNYIYNPPYGGGYNNFKMKNL